LNPCQNNGLCSINTLGQEICFCLPGYTGALCQTSIMTTTTAKPFCTDFNSTLCQSYAAKGYCSLNVYVNGSLIISSCAASCNQSCKTTKAITTTTTTKSCSDYNSTLCQSYFSKGYCSLNVYINSAPIKVSCAASCNSCT
jgi:hypothetical protein